MLQMLNAEAIHVPHRGSAPAQIEILGGNVAFLIDNLTGIIGHIQSGRVRALAVTSAERHPLLPDVPAMRETMPELADLRGQHLVRPVRPRRRCRRRSSAA